MPQLFNNNARALLSAAINESATSITIEAVKADLFPVANVGAGDLPSVNNWFKAVIQDSLGNIEIIYVRTRASGSGVFSNVLRAQEGTTARAFLAGAVVGLRLTALDIEQSINSLSGNNTYYGDNTFLGQNRFEPGIRVGPDDDVAFYYNVAQQSAYIQTGTTGDYKQFRFGDTGDFTSPGNVSAFSDIRLKKDLHVIEHAMDKVSRLTGYTYTRIDSGARQTGLVAQDVLRVMPEAVVPGDHLSVAYGNLVGLLVEAIKELEHRIEKLESAASAK